MLEPSALLRVTRSLSRFDRSQIESFVTVAIALLDELDGDPDLEDNNDLEATDGDDRDVAYAERLNQLSIAETCRGNAGVDDEDDDPGGTDLDQGEMDESYRLPIPEYGIDQRHMVTSPHLGFALDVETMARVDLSQRGTRIDKHRIIPGREAGRLGRGVSA